MSLQRSNHKIKVTWCRFPCLQLLFLLFCHWLILSFFDSPMAIFPVSLRSLDGCFIRACTSFPHHRMISWAGKPFWLAKAVDIPRAVYNFRFFAGAILYATDTSTVLDQVPAINFSTRSPIGVAALITPWNLPLYLLTWKIAPALATGNTAVCKPSELTSLTAFRLAKLMQEVGLPPGVCNMVFGTGQIAGAALVEHPDVSLVSFTGGTVTGER